LRSPKAAKKRVKSGTKKGVLYLTWFLSDIGDFYILMNGIIKNLK